ncbi:hypothetical protein E0Z10_g10825 [Xylaria hypoxylon]|uniref:Uncharacterized protein n=1 Tax=Xylaria hypoxylon TaxID=37992 RepID=A0A4Z0YBG8_9PEZI|nr:hypothetical protein E0Z10_g10825 [Xylaria hypoxylon]
MARFIWDDDVEMTPVSPLKDACAALFTQPQIPTLSIACRPGWNLNEKATWIPSGGIRHDPYIIPEKVIASRPLDPNQLAPLGNVSFARVPEKDIEAFLSKFLGRGEGLTAGANSSESSDEKCCCEIGELKAGIQGQDREVSEREMVTWQV